MYSLVPCALGWRELLQWWEAFCRYTVIYSEPFICSTAPPSAEYKNKPSHLIYFYFKAALSIFGMISGPLLGLYLLGMLFRTSNSIVSIFYYWNIYSHSVTLLQHQDNLQIKLWHIQEVFDCCCVYLAGRTCGNGHRSSVDSVGRDWRTDLPTNSWKDKSTPTEHCALQQHNAPELHDNSSVDQSSNSHPTSWVSQITQNKCPSRSQ